MRELGIVVFLVAVFGLAPIPANADEAPVKIGVLVDMSAAYADFAGKGSVEAVRMAIEDFGGKALGKPIELISGDFQTKPDIGINLARQWYYEGTDVILDIPNSAVALAVNKLAADANKLVIFTSAITDRPTEQDCNGHGLSWMWDTNSVVKAGVTAQIANGFDSWFVLGANYAAGEAWENAVVPAVTTGGGKIAGKVRAPLGSSDFASYLIQAQSSNAKMLLVTTGGADMVNTMKQAQEFGVNKSMKVSLLFAFIVDVDAVGLGVLKDLEFVTAFYWDRTDESRAFAKRFFAKIGKMPTMVQAADYSATLQYLKAVQAAGTKDPSKVTAKMREAPMSDMFMTNGRLMPNGRVIHDMYVVRVKTPEESKYPWDYFKVIATVPGDKAFRPWTESVCSIGK